MDTYVTFRKEVYLLTENLHSMYISC